MCVKDFREAVELAGLMVCSVQNGDEYRQLDMADSPNRYRHDRLKSRQQTLSGSFNLLGQG